MGDAKRRKLNDPFFGRSIEYTAKLFDRDRTLLCEIPFLIPRQQSLHETNLRAIANVGLMASFLQEQDNPETQERLAIALGQESVDALIDWLLNNPIDRFHLQVHGDWIQQENWQKQRDADDVPEFTTEMYTDGEQYALQPEALLSLAI